MEGLLEPDLVEESLGKAEVRATFAVGKGAIAGCFIPVSYTHLRAHETKANLVCRLLLEKKIIKGIPSTFQGIEKNIVDCF